MNTLLEIFPGLTDVLVVLMVAGWIAGVYLAWWLLTDGPEPREDRAESAGAQR